MTHRNKRTHSNSRARAKHIRCVRVRCFNIWSTKNPNAEQSEDSGFLSLHVGMLPTDVSPSQSRESTDVVRSAVKKTAAGKQSVEVLQNAPIIERAFCRSSSETAACPRCHMDTEISDVEREYYNAMAFTPCDVVSYCIECRFFSLINILQL